MIAEAVTIGVILGGSALIAWLAKSKFQPEIDGSLARTEESIVARRKSGHVA